MGNFCALIFITFFCLQDTVPFYTGKIIKENTNSKVYEVSFSDGRWLLPADDIHTRAKTQLNLDPTPVPRSPPQRFKQLTGYKRLVYQTLNTRTPKSLQAIVAAVEAARPNANKKHVLKAVRALQVHGHLKADSKHARSYLALPAPPRRAKTKNSSTSKRSQKNAKTRSRKKKPNNSKATGRRKKKPSTVQASASASANILPYHTSVLPLSGLNAAVCTVFVTPSTQQPYDCALTKVNLDTNEDKYINMQLLCEPHGPGVRYWFYWEWGKTGQAPTFKKDGPFVEAIGRAAFELKFKEKTGVEWTDRYKSHKADRYRFVLPSQNKTKAFKWQYYMKAQNQHNESPGWYDYDSSANTLLNLLCTQWMNNGNYLHSRHVQSKEYTYKVVSVLFNCVFSRA